MALFELPKDMPIAKTSAGTVSWLSSALIIADLFESLVSPARPFTTAANDYAPLS